MSLWALKSSFGMVGPGFGKGLIVGTFAVMGALHSAVLGPAAGFTMGGLAAVGTIHHGRTSVQPSHYGWVTGWRSNTGGWS